ncbi:MAG: gamma-glutamylcyclotransferase [Maricaulaceae bacterium]
MTDLDTETFDVKRGDLIALYGTLRLSEPGFVQLRLADALAPAGRCILKGALYDLGAYPGFVLEPAGPVTADLFEVAEPAVMERLDAHEDFLPGQPKRSMYLRQRLRLTEPDVEAWTYVYNRSVADFPQIAAGDWCEHLAARDPAP